MVTMRKCFFLQTYSLYFSHHRYLFYVQNYSACCARMRASARYNHVAKNPRSPPAAIPDTPWPFEHPVSTIFLRVSTNSTRTFFALTNVFLFILFLCYVRCVRF